MNPRRTAVQPSSEPPATCRHFGVCGGCQWQHVPYAEQLVRKRRRLQSLLHASLGSSSPEVRAVIGTPAPDGTPWRFRQKAAFVFGESPRGGLLLGHYALGSDDLVPVEECPVHGDRANRLAFSLAEALRRARVPAAGARLEGILRHLIVRTSLDEREAVALLVVTRNHPCLRAPIRAFLAGPERPTGFYLNVHERPGPFMVGRQTLRLAGRSHVRENRLGVSFLISPTAFFQTNVEATAALLDEVMDAVVRTETARPRAGPLRVLDLYSGSGLFALPIAALGHRVTAVEENGDATRDAVSNRRLNGVSDLHLKIITGRVEDVLGRLTRGRFDRVVLDPPRQGCGPRVLDAVFRSGAPQRAVYISCNAERLAAELPLMVSHGYHVGRVQPIDMFPHTEHIETVVTLVKDGGGSTVVRRIPSRGRARGPRRRPG